MTIAKLGAFLWIVAAVAVEARTGWEAGPIFMAQPSEKGRLTARGQHWSADFSNSEVALQFRGSAVKIGFNGAQNVAPEGRRQLAGYANFLMGSDPTAWRTGVP